MENYNRLMEKTLQEIKKQGAKPTLLLHACCAPCASACIERLKDYFALTVYFYNPNIDGAEEYHKRARELKRFCDDFGVDYIIEDYNSKEFYSAVKGLEEEKECGKRCSVCYALRLKKATEFAKQNGYEYITTTLTISPLKDAQRLNEIGGALSQKIGVKFLPSDFKKKGGYLRSIELSREYGLYRQNYCGCEFSKHSSPNEIEK